MRLDAGRRTVGHISCLVKILDVGGELDSAGETWAFRTIFKFIVFVGQRVVGQG